MGSIDSTFDMLRSEIQGLRADNRQQFTDLRSDLSGIQRQLVQIGFSLVGVLFAAMVPVR